MPIINNFIPKYKQTVPEYMSIESLTNLSHDMISEQQPVPQVDAYLILNYLVEYCDIWKTCAPNGW